MREFELIAGRECLIVFSFPISVYSFANSVDGGRKRWVLVGIVLGLFMCLIVHVLVSTGFLHELQVQLMKKYASK